MRTLSALREFVGQFIRAELDASSIGFLQSLRDILVYFGLSSGWKSGGRERIIAVLTFQYRLLEP